MPLKTVTDPLKEIKMVKTDLKKVPTQIFFLLIPLGTIAQLFTKTIFPFHNPFKLGYLEKKDLKINQFSALLFLAME